MASPSLGTHLHRCLGQTLAPNRLDLTMLNFVPKHLEEQFLFRETIIRMLTSSYPCQACYLYNFKFLSIWYMCKCVTLDSIYITPLLIILNIFFCLSTIQVSCFESACLKSFDHVSTFWFIESLFKFWSLALFLLEGLQVVSSPMFCLMNKSSEF